MHQAGMVATDGKELADDVLLADMALGNMFDGHPSSTGQFGSPVADAIAERFSKSRIVEDADLPRPQKCRHSLRIADPWQRHRGLPDRADGRAPQTPAIPSLIACGADRQVGQARNARGRPQHRCPSDSP